jgi:transcriptional regulator with XRE-family HTH domain
VQHQEKIGFLAERLRQLRKKRGLTQEETAERANISYKYYQQVELGKKRDLRLSTLMKLAEAFDISVSKLLDSAPRWRNKPN